MAFALENMRDEHFAWKTCGNWKSAWYLPI